MSKRTTARPQKVAAPAHAPAGEDRSRLAPQRPFTDHAGPVTLPAGARDALSAPDGPPDPGSSADSQPPPGHHFSRIRVQAKLAVGSQDNDPHERESDRIADQVVHRLEPAPPDPGTQGTGGAGKGHQPPQAPAVARITPLRRPDGTGEERTVPEPLQGQISQSLGHGQALPAPTQRAFGAVLGHDLGAVRVHAGPEAHGLTRELRARAFTLGRDIYFGPGMYAPDTSEGRRLLAHELTHTVQQGGTGAALVQAKPVESTKKKKILRVTLFVDRDQVVLDFDDDSSATLPTVHNGRPASGTYPVTRVAGKLRHGARGVINDKGYLIEWKMPKDATFEGVKSYTLRVIPGQPGSATQGTTESTPKVGAERGEVGGEAATSPTPDSGPGASPRLTPEEEARWRALAELMQGATAQAQEDPAELVRLYGVLRDTVEDPQFSKTKGEPWVHFAKFLDENRDKIEGLLRGNPPGRLTQEKLEKIIAEYGKFVAVEPVEPEGPERLETLEDFEKEFKYDPGWQKLSKADRKLLLEYARLTPEELSEHKVDFSRVTTSMKVNMALKLSWKSWPGEIAEAAKSAFSDPSFIVTLVVIMGIYVGLWLTPEPSGVTKVAAGVLTVALLAQFAWEDIYGFAKAWSRLFDDCAAATTTAELEAAGDRFAKKVGQVGFDIILFIVMWRIGKRVGPKVQKIGAERGVARAEAALRAVEAKPGSGVPKQASGEAARVLDTAKGRAKDTTATAVLDALADLVPEGARQGLTKFRASIKGGDAAALKALEARIGKGQDVGHFLTEYAMSPEAKAPVQAELIEAQGKYARAKLVEMETLADPTLRKEARAELAKMRQARRAELVRSLRERLSKWGILEDPGVQRAAKAKDVRELTGQLGEATARTLLEAEYPASKGFRILSNLEIVREVNGFDSIAKWQAAERTAGRKGDVGGLYEAGGKLWKSVTEIDALVVDRGPTGKLRPVEMEQMKAGEKGTSSQAQQQNTRAQQALGEIAAGSPEVRIFDRVGKNTLGTERTAEFDLSNLNTLKTTTRGTPGKGFTKEIPFPREVLEWVAESIVSQGLPPAGPATIPPLTSESAQPEREKEAAGATR